MVEKKNTYVEANREIKDGFHMNEGTEWIWFVFFVALASVICVVGFEGFFLYVLSVFLIIICCLVLYWTIKLVVIFLAKVMLTMGENEKVFNTELVSIQEDKTEQNKKVAKEESVSKKGDKMEENKSFVNEEYEYPSTAEVFGVFKSFFKGLFFILFIILNSQITTNILLGLVTWKIFERYW